MRKSYCITFLICLGIATFIQGQNFNLLEVQSEAERNWVDSLYNSLNKEQKVAQLMMIRAHSDGNVANVNRVKKLIKKYKIGALCFFQGTPQRQAELTASYQRLSDIPLLIATDAEWGMGMRFKEEAISFPRQLTLGAIDDVSHIYRMGYRIGKRLKMIGVHLNFAPVVDVNNNINNPVINNRSFGDNKKIVAQYGSAYMRGMQDAGIAACAKHFPGHGDTQVDSHKDLPVIPYDYERLDSIELYPFRRLIKDGVASVMVAHLNMPEFESRSNYASTLSPSVVTGLLKKKLNFKGLVITDAMEMDAVTEHFEDGEAEALAIMAGNDMLCLPVSVEEAIDKILAYIDQGKIRMSRVEQSVKKVLRLKYRLGLHKNAMPSHFDRSDIFNPNDLALKSRLIEESITLVRNKDKEIPIQEVDKSIIGSVGFGHENISHFQRRMSDYSRVIHFTSGRQPSEDLKDKLLERASDMDLMVATFHDMSKYASRHHGIARDAIALLKKIQRKTKLIIVLFGSPYATRYFEEFNNIIVAYQDDKLTQDLTAQALFGAIPFQGSLPVTASPEFTEGTGINVSSLYRLGYAIPERVGMNSDTLALIDTLVKKMINRGAAPGCQILVARKGKIVYNKAFGYFTYRETNPVLTSDIYDVASITKTAATTISIMQLVDDGLIEITDKLGEHYSLTNGTNKAHLSIRDIMSHRSGLRAWIPFYKGTLDENEKPDPHIYHSDQSKKFNVHVADRLWMRNTYVDTVLSEIINSPVKPRGHYKYSDLGMIMLGKMIEEIDGRPLDKYASDVYYDPLGLRSTVFNPHEHHTSGNVVPAEKDEYFRYQEIRGYVHDMGSAMLGGVAGHAGLFTNTHDLAVIYQMLLNGGYYGGRRYLRQETVNLFTQRVPGASRRAIGFDMKQLDPHISVNLSELASASTFGHLGFTGCAVWADPKEELIYIFLSNRTYPTMENRKFITGDYRPKVQSIIYRAIISGESS